MSEQNTFCLPSINTKLRKVHLMSLTHCVSTTPGRKETVINLITTVLIFVVNTCRWEGPRGWGRFSLGRLVRRGGGPILRIPAATRSYLTRPQWHAPPPPTVSRPLSESRSQRRPQSQTCDFGPAFHAPVTPVISEYRDLYVPAQRPRFSRGPPNHYAARNYCPIRPVVSEALSR